MKRLAQFVAVLAVALLAAQPALAGLPCVAGTRAACAPGCPMAMNDMGFDCPMTSQMAAGECPQSCCAHALPQATAPLAASEKLKLAAPASANALPAVLFAAKTAVTVEAPIEAQTASPPPYILNRVFRI